MNTIQPTTESTRRIYQTARMIQHRKIIARQYRDWEITRLLGFTVDGEPLTALFAVRPWHQYWCFRLEFDELDLTSQPGNTFAGILERCGPDGIKRVHALWERHKSACSSGASILDGGWRWWHGRGLSRALVDELRDLVVARYTKANEIFELRRQRRAGQSPQKST